MTTFIPAQCFACARLDRTTLVQGDLMVVRCTAYPVRIPDDIRTFGDDHRQPRGDEATPLTFVQADNGQAAFSDWQAFASAAGSDAA